MSEYTISEIRPSNKRDLRKMDALLEKEGIQRDKNLDYSIGLFDEDYNLVATGSCFKNTLRCMAVDSDHQGEGLLNQVVTQLMDHQYQVGNVELFLYTKCDSAKFFQDLGFYEIARVEGKVVFMENRRNGFSNYLEELKKTARPGDRVAAVVMNANPFTLGHQYLLERTSGENDVVHVFVVSEDVSLVPFSVRYDLVQKGSAHLPNLIYHPTGSYIISNATFPSYFLKDEEVVIESHAKLDIHVFQKIAAALGIQRRYVGEEPFSQVTGIYNRVMQEELAACGMECVVIPRKTDGDAPISASQVRKAIQEGRLEEIRHLVPASTYEYFTSPEAEPVIEKIRKAAEVIHYSKKGRSPPAHWPGSGPFIFHFCLYPISLRLTLSCPKTAPASQIRRRPRENRVPRCGPWKAPKKADTRNTRSGKQRAPRPPCFSCGCPFIYPPLPHPAAPVASASVFSARFLL